MTIPPPPEEELETPRVERDPDRAFDCRRCGMYFAPALGQWIFHKLCDMCFYRFDEQKMAGRLSVFGGPVPEFSTQDVDVWIAWETSCPVNKV
jgi:hypothetical protein